MHSVEGVIDMDDLTRRYALSLYADYRLGLIGDEILDPREAMEFVEDIYGIDAARRARAICRENYPVRGEEGYKG
jgi:hypothetical protein